MSRHSAWAWLAAGWVLSFNPAADGLNARRDGWEWVERYDSAWACEEGRREAALEKAEKQAARSQKVAANNTALRTLLQYRCEHESRAPKRRRGLMPWTWWR